MARQRAAATAKVPHLDGCPADEDRIETYENKGPKGWVVVTRCQECGAQITKKPTEEPSLETTEA